MAPKAKLKINTVVCRQNLMEDMHDWLLRLNPDRWKMLWVIPIHGAEAISDKDFAGFVDRHSAIPNAIVEDNSDMHRSYLMINPDGKFYQRDGSEYVYGPELQAVGAVRALEGVEFDIESYSKRY
jgi:radical S-adenosyl methionine domain-containing protein 2